MSVHFSNLTAKQKRVYSVIESYIKSKGIPPTVREIGEIVGEKTPGAVQGILNRLEQKGVIKRQVGAARSIQLTMDNSIYAQQVFIPEIKKVTARNFNDLLNIYNIQKYHPVSHDMTGIMDTDFAMECPEDNVFGINRINKEILFFRREGSIKEGEIVLVLHENHLLLRRYSGSVDNDTLNLEGMNKVIDKEKFKKDEIDIIGKLVGRYIKY